MFVDYQTEWTFENIDEIEGDPNIQKYLFGMNMSIARGIDLYYQMCGRKHNYVEQGFDDDGSGGYLPRVTLSKSLGIEYINKLKANDKELEVVWFYNENGDFVLPFNNLGYKPDEMVFKVFYTEKIKNIELDAAYDFDLGDIGISDELARLLPYYIKAEAYEEDEPELAAQARALYMQGLLGLPRVHHKAQVKVKRNKIFNG